MYFSVYCDSIVIVSELNLFLYFFVLGISAKSVVNKKVDKIFEEFN